MLQGTQDVNAVNIVLTNGFAADASRALRNVGLAQYFAAVCDTRGNVVRNPSEEGAKPEHLSVDGAGIGGRYSKTSFIASCCFKPAEASRLFGVNGLEHVVYVDDDPELFNPPR